MKTNLPVLWDRAQCTEYLMHLEFGKERLVRGQHRGVTPAELTTYAKAERPERASRVSRESSSSQLYCSIGAKEWQRMKR